MKYCSHCGNELLDEAIICPKCGCQVEGTSVPKQKTKKSNKAIASLVLGIVSVVVSSPSFVFGFISMASLACGILALIFAIQEFKAERQNGFVIAGLVTGIVGILDSIIGAIIYIIALSIVL